MPTGDIILDVSSLRSHGDTLYLSGSSAVAKILFIGVDSAATGTSIGLIDADPYTMKLMVTQNGGAIGVLVGTTQGGGTEEAAACCPLYISSSVGLRLYTSPQSDEMVNVTYVEMSS